MWRYWRVKKKNRPKIIGENLFGPAQGGKKTPSKHLSCAEIIQSLWFLLRNFNLYEFLQPLKCKRVLKKIQSRCKQSKSKDLIFILFPWNSFIHSFSLALSIRSIFNASAESTVWPAARSCNLYMVACVSATKNKYFMAHKCQKWRSIRFPHGFFPSSILLQKHKEQRAQVTHARTYKYMK